ncbi:MAG: hypothetical protein IJ215_02405 [Clostridia bacterium]|nr:hypothetical protein [Clostridia bacterium]
MMKNLKKDLKEKRNKKINLREQRGSEVLQVILIAGILLVIVITVFYPQMKGLFSDVMTTISTWFKTTGSAPFTV